MAPPLRDTETFIHTKEKFSSRARSNSFSSLYYCDETMVKRDPMFPYVHVTFNYIQNIIEGRDIVVHIYCKRIIR